MGNDATALWRRVDFGDVSRPGLMDNGDASSPGEAARGWCRAPEDGVNDADAGSGRVDVR
jgi:hypothetical protein